MTDSTKHAAKEPFVRIIKKGLPSPARAIGVRAASLLVALLICSLYILIVGRGEVTLGNAFSQIDDRLKQNPAYVVLARSYCRLRADR